MNAQQNMDLLSNNNNDPDRPPPPIFITSADNLQLQQQQQQQQQHQQQANYYLSINEQQQQHQSAPNSPLSTHSSPRLSHPLTVQTQQLNQFNNSGQRSPSSLIAPSYQNAVNTPLPPSPCPTSPGFLTSSDEDHTNSNLYSPQSRTPIMNQNSYIMDPNQQQQHQFNQTNFHP
jgi:hypothetical protein